MLCSVCQQFNIRALLSQCLVRETSSKPALAIHGIYPEYQGLPRFFQQQVGLLALRASADGGCSLCSLIWREWSHDKPAEYIQREYLDAGQSEEPIFLGVSNWAPAAHGMPFLTATQFLDKGRERRLGIFEVYAERGRVPGGFEHLLAREVYADPGSEGCLAVADGWMRDCLEKHQGCKTWFSELSFTPTRVLDLRPDSDESVIRLIDRGGENGQSGRKPWAALSYCWGGPSEFVLTKAKLTQWTREMRLEDFPATLRDAVVVTRRLGIRYLWVDALCILQDKDDMTDWSAQAPLMDGIYRSAQVTISAASSPCADHGFLTPRHLPALTCQLRWKSEDGQDSIPVFLRSESALWDMSMRSGHLDSRGWTLQETLLSRRMLSFSPQQMAWECLQRRTDEGGRPVAPGEKWREKPYMQTLEGKFGNQKSCTNYQTRYNVSSAALKLICLISAFTHVNGRKY